MAYTTINKPADYFNTLLYTGDSATSTAGTLARTISGVGFQPDFVWVKGRTAGGYDSHGLHDVVRTAPKWLRSDGTSAEADVTTGFSAGGIGSFTSDGFGIYSGTAGTTTNYNTSSTTYAAWNWLAGGTASSNTDGSITSSVSASTASGFSIVSYTGTGSAATVGHGLNSAPEMIILKNRDVANNWITGCEYYSGWDYIIELNLTDAESNAGGAPQNFTTTPPTSSVYSVGTSTNSNGSGNDIIAYCFHSVKGYSKIGKYTGNGNADGTFVYTGFKPAWVIVKPYTATSNWQIFDNKRNTFNLVNSRIPANDSAAENSGLDFADFVSNGFKIRGTSSGWNTSGTGYIYMAFAENPLTTSGGTPATAR